MTAGEEAMAKEDVDENGLSGWRKREFDALTAAPLRTTPSLGNDPVLMRALFGPSQAEVSEEWALSLLVQATPEETNK